jgi:hypothetical protein
LGQKLQFETGNSCKQCLHAAIFAYFSRPRSQALYQPEPGYARALVLDFYGRRLHFYGRRLHFYGRHVFSMEDTYKFSKEGMYKFSKEGMYKFSKEGMYKFSKEGMYKFSMEGMLHVHL